MASFRILNQAPQYLLANGLVNAGGQLFFYATDLTTPKNTWSDPYMSTLNANPVIMDAAGRTLADVWGDGEYGVVMKDAAGVTIWTRNNVKADVGAGTAIPALSMGQFLTNDGSVLQWQQIVLLPDLAGTSGSILYSDGFIPYWGPPPAVPTPPTPAIAVTATSVSLDDGGTAPNKMLIQTGSAVTTGASGRLAQIAVTFPVAFSSTPVWVDVAVTTGSLSSFGNMPTHAITASSATGFTVKFTMSELDDSQSGFDYNANVPFNYIAIGIIA